MYLFIVNPFKKRLSRVKQHKRLFIRSTIVECSVIWQIIKVIICIIDNNNYIINNFIIQPFGDFYVL